MSSHAFDSTGFGDDLDALFDPEPGFEPGLSELDGPAPDGNAAARTASASPTAAPVMRPIPAISIAAFVEQRSTADLLQRVAGDRRLGEASFALEQGGAAAAEAWLREHPAPNLLIIESGMDAARMVTQIDAVAEQCEPGVEVLVIGMQNDVQLYRQLMARGVREYLVPPLDPAAILSSVSNLFSDPDAPFIGKQIAVVGAKGGVGSSTLAHNLAWSLSQNVGVATTLVDLDITFGTTALDFNRESAQHVTDALSDPDRADDALIERLLLKVGDRLSLFTAPADLSAEFDISTEAYGIVMDRVRRRVPYVVLDLPHLWSPWMAGTLAEADEVILVCQPDLASLRNGKNLADRLAADRQGQRPPRLVLNMAGVKDRPEIPARDFASALGLQPEIIIPFDPRLFGLAANKGEMLSQAAPDAEPAKALDYLASQLTGKPAEAPKKSILQKMLGR